MSLPEVLLWRLLRRHPEGVKIRRQHPVGRYVLDFYCAGAKIAFEIDGTAHDMGDQPFREEARDDWFKQQGVELVRIPAADVLRSPSDVAASIVQYCLR